MNASAYVEVVFQFQRGTLHQDQQSTFRIPQEWSFEDGTQKLFVRSRSFGSFLKKKNWHVLFDIQEEVEIFRQFSVIQVVLRVNEILAC